MPEKMPSSPEIEVTSEEIADRVPSEAGSIELFYNAAGFADHPQLTPERRQKLKAYLLTNVGPWQHVDGKDITVTDIDVQPDQIRVTIEGFGQSATTEIPV